MGNLLEIKDLRVSFCIEGKEMPAVMGASLQVKEGETLVLAGESGAGKSVTAFSVTRLLTHNARIVSGEAIFRQKDLLSLPEQELAKIRGKDIAYIFQEPSSYLNPVYTVGNQLAETIELHQGKGREEAKDIALKLLDSVKIRDPERVFFDYPHQLSGGMNQRAFLAMALACKPELLIADEPTTSLDVTVESQILSLLMGLKKEMGFSLLFITHNLSIAKRIADRICVMQKGRVVEEGSKDELFARPKHPHTKELISAFEMIGSL